VNWFPKAIRNGLRWFGPDSHLIRRPPVDDPDQQFF